jgi:hypothetical protein
MVSRLVIDRMLAIGSEPTGRKLLHAVTRRMAFHL